ncbi:MAG: response regulator transcription factor [Actinomycetota bacterium]|nr:response regulator transcription factor [Actinomycetota bacterium]
MSIRVMIVDDDPTVRVTLARFFALHKDLKVVGEATNGRDGVELAQRVKADVIVMDARMPEMNGLEATEQIRSLGINTPVLIFSAEDGVAGKINGLAKVGFLTKHGSGPRETIAAIRELAS